MPFGGLLTVGLISAGSNILGGVLGRNSSKNAASNFTKNALYAQDAINKNTGTSLDAVDKNTTDANTNWQNILNQNMGLLKPYTDVGQTAASGLNDALKNPFQFNLADDPGYAFRLKQGQDAVEKSAAARGGSMSGGALKALTQYGQGFASNEYNNAFQRHQQQIGNLLSGAGLGLSASNTGVGAGNAFAQGSSNNLNQNSALISQILGQNSGLTLDNFTNIGNAGAAGTTAAGNAVTGAISGLGNTANNTFLYNLLSQGSGGIGLGAGANLGGLPSGTGIPPITFSAPA